MNLMDSEKILRVTFKSMNQKLGPSQNLGFTFWIKEKFCGSLALGLFHMLLQKLPESTKWTPLLFETTAIK